MEAETGQFPNFVRHLDFILSDPDHTPAYKSHFSIAAFLNHSRVQLLKALPSKDQLHQRVLSDTSGILLPDLQQPPGTPRAVGSKRYKPRGCKLKPDENPPYLIDRNRLIIMWNTFPMHRDRIVLAKANALTKRTANGTVSISAPAVGVQPGSPIAKEMIIPRDDWNRVRDKMRRLKKNYNIIESFDLEPWEEELNSKEKRKKRKRNKVVEAMAEFAVAEDDGEEEGEHMWNVLPSIEVDGEGDLEMKLEIGE